MRCCETKNLDRVTWKSNQALLKVEEEELTGIKRSKFACGGGDAKEGKMAIFSSFAPPPQRELARRLQIHKISLLTKYKLVNVKI